MSATRDAASRARADALAFDLPGGGHALFTSRAEGNLSTGSGEGSEHGVRRRERLCQVLDLRWACSSRQVHGTTVHTVERVAASGGTPLAIDADGHATAIPHVGAMIMCADCLPVALGCDGAVAMLHAGWRGLAAGVLEHGVARLRELARGPAGGHRVTAVIGPGAGPCCYEVGAEVHAIFAAGHARGPRTPLPMRGPCDLRAIARARLLAAGVQEVRHVDACTICDERFFSHRREGARAGRQAGVAWLS